MGELINLTLSQVQSHQPLSGSTTFNRIEITSSPDPLNGDFLRNFQFERVVMLNIDCSLQDNSFLHFNILDLWDI